MLYARRIWPAVILVGLLCSAAQSQDHARLGDSAFEKGDFQEAAKNYTEALAAKPSFPLYVNLGHCYTRLERWKEAAKAYQAAVRLDKGAVTLEIWRFLAQALYNDNQYRQAIEALGQAASLEPGDKYDILIARCMIGLEQWVQAQSVLSGRLKHAPDNVETLELLAYVVGQLGDWPGVIDMYRQLLIAKPDHTEYRISLANALAADGRNKQAIDTLEFAWRVDRGLSENTNRLLADLYLTEKMPREAAACYARIIVASENPTAEDFYRLGIAYFQTSELTSARDAFAGMQKATPADARADLYLGYIAAQRGDFDRAMVFYNAAEQKSPTLIDAIVATADLQMKKARYNDAAASFAKAIELGDNRPLIHYNHTLALMRHGDTGQAQAALKKALAEHPSDSNLIGLLDQCIEEDACSESP
jgi:tetratricopeptide (TPR) repeat protein